MAAKLLVIADDFTGALDTGVQFASAGIETRVYPSPSVYLKGGQAPEANSQVLVVNAESRHLPAADAYKIVYKLALHARESGCAHIYKKTDSALRGNVGAELSAVLAATGEQSLAFVPAYPQMNRCTRKGIHYIDGMPVAESVFGEDPFEPVASSSVAEIIGSQSGVTVRLYGSAVEFEDDRLGSTEVPESTRSFESVGSTESGGSLKSTGSPEIVERTESAVEHDDPQEILVFDASTDEDLSAIGMSLKQADKLRVLAGCAGFAGVLPELLEFDSRNQELPTLPQKLLVICGSVNPITQAQLAYAEAKGFVRMQLTGEQLLEQNWWGNTQGEVGLQAIRDRLALGSNCILDSSSPMEPELIRNLNSEDLRVRISASLGALAKQLASHTADHLLFITGGDTLISCMDALGVSEIEPMRELYPGVVLSRITLESEERFVVSKSGGFGSEELLEELAEMLKTQAV